MIQLVTHFEGQFIEIKDFKNFFLPTRLIIQLFEFLKVYG